MSNPPAGYHLARGAYYTLDGQGPYAWDGTSMVPLGGAGVANQLVPVLFTGAGWHIVWFGRGRLMQIEVTASPGGGSILVEDALTTGTGTSYGSTAIAADTTPTILFGSGLGQDIYMAALLTVTGTISGFATVQTRN